MSGGLLPDPSVTNPVGQSGRVTPGRLVSWTTDGVVQDSGFTPISSGLTPTLLAIVNVLNYGARGDGITDDTNAIQAVIDAYAGKAVVFIPNTDAFYVCSTLLVPTGTDLLIDGTVMAKSDSGTLIQIGNANNVTVRGRGVLDGNGVNQTSVQAVFYAFNSTNVQLSGLTLQNSYNWNLNIVGSSRVRVFGVSMIGGKNANEFAAGCDDCWLIGCSIDGPTGDPGFAFYGGVTNSKAIGNTVKNAAGSGINVLCDAPQPAPCNNITIADNIVHNNGTSGIQTNRGVGGTGQHSVILIRGNIIYSDGGGSNPNGAEIYCNYLYDSTISGNITTGTGSAYGIYIDSSSKNVTISDNTVFNMGSVTLAGGGLHIDSTNHVHANGNVIYDNRDTPYMTSSISGAAGNENVFYNNALGTLPITITPLSNTIFNNATFTNWAFSFGSAAPEVVIDSVGIIYPGGSNSFGFTWSGTEASMQIDGSDQGIVLTNKGKVAFNGTAPIVMPVVTGSKGGNAALASLMTALAAYGLVTDSTT